MKYKCLIGLILLAGYTLPVSLGDVYYGTVNGVIKLTDKQYCYIKPCQCKCSKTLHKGTYSKTNKSLYNWVSKKVPKEEYVDMSDVIITK